MGARLRGGHARWGRVSTRRRRDPLVATATRADRPSQGWIGQRVERRPGRSAGRADGDLAAARRQHGRAHVRWRPNFVSSIDHPTVWWSRCLAAAAHKSPGVASHVEEKRYRCIVTCVRVSERVARQASIQPYLRDRRGPLVRPLRIYTLDPSVSDSTGRCRDSPCALREVRAWPDRVDLLPGDWRRRAQAAARHSAGPRRFRSLLSSGLSPIPV